MLRIGRRQRVLSNAVGKVYSPSTEGVSASKDSHVSGLKSIRGSITTTGGNHQAVSHRVPLSGSGSTHTVSGNLPGGLGQGSGGFGGGSGYGGSRATVDRYNAVNDDLSRGTIAEDWIPQDPRMQNRMFRIMVSRGLLEGPIIETISELTWGGDFDLTGIEDEQILDTYYAAKEATNINAMFEDMTKEYLTTGKLIVQFILDPAQGIWTDALMHSSDNVRVGYVPRTGYTPRLDLLPDPMLQEWAKSQDPRDIESKKGFPKQLLEQFSMNREVPLDPMITAYLPRRMFFNDVFGSSFLTRNITLWGLEKSLINATLAGHRRRSGPIYHLAVGSEQWEPNADQIDALVGAYMAAEEDSVSSVIGTRHDVEINQVRGALSEMWKWSDEWSFLLEAKLKALGVSDAVASGDVDIISSPTNFVARLRAHRAYVVEYLLNQKFFRSLAQVHGFVRRTPAELNHRIRVKRQDQELILPTPVFHRNLDMVSDTVRMDLLDKMEEKGIPVSMSEWNRTCGGGDMTDRMRAAVSDLKFKMEYAKFARIKQQMDALLESAGDNEDMDEQLKSMEEELKKIKFSDDEEGYDVAKLTEKGKRKAKEAADGVIESARAHAPIDTSSIGSAEHDAGINRLQANRDRNTLCQVGKIG